MLEKCSTDEAPWYVVPANRKWFRNFAISHIVKATLDDLDLQLPEPTVDIDEIRKKYHAALARQRREHEANETGSK